ncbi:hypothetical protein [Arenibacter algicola]|jgi:hypothetical protein|uniref:Uncharacterized protein n=1 Tax=Arenibacter algicola TaxID=616991 RepID=A0A221UXD6_9FLAO|nr:hypothetical protein [Arenibacter algicola]ASO05776.1 hypothetical protein AREALGSMS7_02328 [Arenibacter algicola]|tara:strand:- start:786 stop:962 length:177 start_codon:yes stop_codon:yes gene_type:complete
MKNYFVNKVAIPTISKNSVLKELVNGVFSGLWMNEDEKIESIMKFNIRYENNRFYVQM